MKTIYERLLGPPVAAGLPFGEHELAEPHTTSDPRCRLVPSWVHPGTALCRPVQRKISNLAIFLGVGGLS